MTEEDVYEIDSVPRFANFGDNGQLANDTMGDKFFVRLNIYLYFFSVFK